ncbi:MAG: hypothetical protein Q4Q17_03670 [Tissierellia bacterium]|nr:hypothetical protein [Tissierellia bacterium]
MKKFLLILALFTLACLVIGMVSFLIFDLGEYSRLMAKPMGSMEGSETYPIYDGMKIFAENAVYTFEVIFDNIQNFFDSIF